jgi:hypothetical protein
VAATCVHVEVVWAYDRPTFCAKAGRLHAKKTNCTWQQDKSKASRGIEDIYELTYVRKNGSRFLATV